jgi:hypothetical protein
MLLSLSILCPETEAGEQSSKRRLIRHVSEILLSNPSNASILSESDLITVLVRLLPAIPERYVHNSPFQCTCPC